MKQSLQLKLGQHLTLTPQLQQSIRLLQLSTLDLNQELERFIMENPLLEREDSDAERIVVPNGTEYHNDEPHTVDTPQATAAETTTPDAENAALMDTWGDAETEHIEDTPYTYRDDGDEREYSQIAAVHASLTQYLSEQLNLVQLSTIDKQLAMFVIAHLNEDGYLESSLEELHAMLPPEMEIEPEELQIALRHVQNLDPTGVAARNLRECLILQLDALPSATPQLALAKKMVTDYLDTLAQHDFNKLRRVLNCSEDELKRAQTLVKSLNPKPCQAYLQEEARYIVADVIVKKTKNKWTVSLNPDAIPKLRLNSLYASILQNNRGQSNPQLASQLQEARWLIKNVQQRFETILKVSQAIVERQKHFFDHGEVAMRPLVLREIADTVGLHESTVSRVTTQKFMITPRGIYELKYFFGSHVSTDVGGAASSTAIRALIKQLIAAEDARKPLSDHRISEILAQQGIVVARRTIAKYRETLQIQPANLRKSL
ncbi:MAG: RNA polymerase factor sigma-54 [Burkholderiales bacterium]